MSSALASLGPRWSSLASLGPRWSSLASLGPRWSSLASLGPRWSSLASLGPRWSSRASLGPRWSSRASLGPRWSSLASLGPRWSSLASLGPRWSSLASLGPRWSSLASLGPRWSSRASLGPRWSSRASLGPRWSSLASLGPRSPVWARLAQVCGYASSQNAPPASRSRLKGERGEPVFQYVGHGRKPNHKVFVWGFSFTGALGIPSFVVPDSGRKRPRKYQLTPYRLETADKISSASCGYGFTLLASSTRDATKLWGMGLNKDSQLGFQRSQHSKLVSYEYVLEPSPVALPLSRPLHTRLLQVSCGRAHSLVLTDQEGVFSFGNNSYGQCGRPIVEEEVYSGSHIIHKIDGFSGKVVQVACGQDHSLFLTEEGTVFSCGWGADGQTGLGHQRRSWRPAEVGGDLSGVQVQQVSTYGDCSLALSRDGELFGWGNSEYRQLAAATDRAQISTPRRLPLDVCGRLVQAACGGSQVAVLNDRGDVFVWGYGILGKGPRLSESSVPEQIPPSLFGRSEFNPTAAVTQVRCGLNHFAAVTDRGELFVWGKNVRGCLGVGTRDDQYFPWRVTVPGQVVDVVCGVDHMVALVKTMV